MNGDGYDDVIVGAPGVYMLSPAGSAYVHLGDASGISSAPDFTLTGATMGDEFGGAVSSAGDVNGDGYADILVGAPRDDGPSSDGGSVSVYLGGPAGIDTTPHQSYAGATTDDLLGSAVAPAGDVNDDGYGDIIIGGETDSFVFDMAGEARVYLGGPGGLGSTADTTLSGGLGDDFGASVSSAGDVDGDGYDDVLIGEPLSSDVGQWAGAVYLHRGSATGLVTTPEETFTGTLTSELGSSVARAGDVNADGYSDIILGARRDDTAASMAGAAYVLYGAAGGIVLLAGTVLFGETAGDLFGTSVASLWRAVGKWFGLEGRGA